MPSTLLHKKAKLIAAFLILILCRKLLFVVPICHYCTCTESRLIVVVVTKFFPVSLVTISLFRMADANTAQAPVDCCFFNSPAPCCHHLHCYVASTTASIQKVGDCHVLLDFSFPFLLSSECHCIAMASLIVVFLFLKLLLLPLSLWFLDYFCH